MGVGVLGCVQAKVMGFFAVSDRCTDCFSCTNLHATHALASPTHRHEELSKILQLKMTDFARRMTDSSRRSRSWKRVPRTGNSKISKCLFCSQSDSTSQAI